MSLAPGWPGAVTTVPSATGWTTPLNDVVTRMSIGATRLATSWRDAPPNAEAILAAVTMSGWDDLPRDETDSIAHWSGDGILSGLRRSGARAIQISGFVRGSVNGVLDAKDELAAAEGTFVVDERTRVLAREADIRVSALRWGRLSPIFDRYTLTLTADDPLRYSTATLDLVNGANVLLNRGKREAAPVLEFVGPHNAVTITHPGGVYSLTALAAGVSRTVDLRNGDVWQGGVRVFGAESGPAPVVPAGGASLTFAGLGSGAARARRFEAWS